jgi:hypothetical protein
MNALEWRGNDLLIIRNELAAVLNAISVYVPCIQTKKKPPWSESASELYRPSDRRLSAKRLPTFADRGCHVVSVTDPSGRILLVF